MWAGGHGILNTVDSFATGGARGTGGFLRSRVVIMLTWDLLQSTQVLKKSSRRVLIAQEVERI